MCSNISNLIHVFIVTVSLFSAFWMKLVKHYISGLFCILAKMYKLCRSKAKSLNRRWSYWYRELQFPVCQNPHVSSEVWQLLWAVRAAESSLQVTERGHIPISLSFTWSATLPPWSASGSLTHPLMSSPTNYNPVETPSPLICICSSTHAINNCGEHFFLNP